MKIGIYSPYLDTSGGGERYMLTIAEILSVENTVDIFLDKHLQTFDKKQIISKNTKLLDLDLSKVNFINAPFGKDTNFLQRVNFLKKYDVIFYLTDGSIFYSTAKKSILHIQSPTKVNNNSLWKKIKKTSWNLIIYNSLFTKQYCERYWGLKGEVVYPPVDVKSFSSGKKKRQIISVGRFSESKKHKVMIDAFKKITDRQKTKDWVLDLVGSSKDGDTVYIEELKKLADGYHIRIQENLEFSELKKLYGESAIYWHAAGYGEEDETKMEHFGITTVEAMASGCVPVVVKLGGQKEIVEEGMNGFLWNSSEELENKTINLINDRKNMVKISENAIKSAEKFSKEKFAQHLKTLI